MGNSTIKKVNINDLPETTDVSSGDYIIVQGIDQTARIKFADIIFGKENTTFGQEINELYSRIDSLEKKLTEAESKIAALESS